jgi:phosphoglycerol transferase
VTTQAVEDSASTTPPVVPHDERRLRATFVEPVAVLVSSCLGFVLGFGGLRHLSEPQGLADLQVAYVGGHFWAMGTPFGNAHWGFPIGMDERYFPTADILQNALAGLLGRLSNNPYLGMNATWALSFPATALAAWWVMRLTGLRGPVAVVLASALTFLPYHWLRIEHIYLGSMYSAVLGVGLALLIGSGWVEREWRRRRQARWALVGVGAVAAVIGLSGIYYVCFTVILCVVALGHRIVRGASWRGLLLAAAPLAATVGVLAAALAPSALYVHQNPPLAPVADRLPIESVTYSGIFSQLVLPSTRSWVPLGPVEDLVTEANTTAAGVPDAGVLWDADSGSVLTAVGLAFLLVGAVVLGRRRHLGSGEPAVAEVTPVDLGLLAAMLAASLLFFVPWGLNYVFALTVTPQIRGWDRLVPVLQTLEFAMVALLWRQLGLWTRGLKAAAVAVLLSVVVLFDTVLPFRSFFQANSVTGAAERDAGATYAASLNRAVPAHCGVLQLPYIAYPESAPREGLAAYSHFTAGLTNAQKDWSFGAMKGTAGSRWQEELGSTLTASDVDHLGEAGFCAVHVDRRGFTPEEFAAVTTQLGQVLGDPVANGHSGDWTAYEIPADEVSTGDFDPSHLTPEEREFYFPSGD